jgi:hypothetical protein
MRDNESFFIARILPKEGDRKAFAAVDRKINNMEKTFIPIIDGVICDDIISSRKISTEVKSK